jgi:hypothetical protein
VFQWPAINGDNRAFQLGKVGQRPHPRLVILKEHDLTFLTMAGFPGADTPLQRPAHIIRILTRIFILQILEHRSRRNLRTGLEQGKDIAQPGILNVAPLQGEHGSVAASTVFKLQPHINAGAT